MINSTESASSTLEALRSGVEEASIKALIPSLKKGTITMLFSDIVGSTPLKRGGSGAEQRYFTEIKPRHDNLLKSEILKADGFILNVIGDSFFAGFQSAKNAVQCAHAIQDAISQDPIPTLQGPLKVRIGVHTGEPVVYQNVLDRYDLFGSDVDRAARIETLSGAEQVFLSPQTKALAEGLEGLRFHSHGRFYLKGLGWSEIFELLWNDRKPRRPHGSAQDLDPGPQSDFVGRVKELGELRKRLTENRLVTLTGSGGMGKTRLAWEIVRHSDGETWAAGGVSFASLDQVAVDTEKAVHDALVASLELDPASAGGAMPALQAEFQGKFQGGPSLLVVDNCETAPQSVARIVFELLTHCPQLRILATSQRQLGVLTLEAVFNLEPMSHPVGEVATIATLESMDSYQLFVASARRTEPEWSVADAEVKTLARILRLTDGTPLAIELVAAAVPYRSLGQIESELAATPLGAITDIEDIAGTVAGPLRERHRSLLRCFEWSFMHLADAERDGFTRLGVFAGSFTEAAVRQVCGIESALALLRRLMRASLVRRRAALDPSRYFLLRTTRAFARLKAGAAGIADQLEARHVQFFSDLVISSQVDELDELVAWEHDWPDLLAAAYLAQKLGDRETVWLISRSLGPFLMHRGLWQEREQLNRSAIVAAEQAKAWLPLQGALVDLGVVLEAQGRWDNAVVVFKRSLDPNQCNASPNAALKAKALQRIGRVLEKLGRVQDAQAALEELQRLTPQLSSPKSRAQSLDHEGHMLQNQGRWVDAEAKYRESLGVRESFGDADGMAYSRDNLGVNLALRGDWAAAERELRQSLLHWRSLGSTKHQRIVLTHLGDMLRREGRYQDSRRCLEESLQLSGDDPKGQAVALAMLGRVLRLQAHWAEAEKALRSSLKISESLNDVQGASLSYDELGSGFMLQRRWIEAAAAFEQSCSLKRTTGHNDDGGLAITLDRLAQVHVRVGDIEKAKALCRESIDLSRKVGRSNQASLAIMNLALMCAAQGDKHAALEKFAEAIGELKTNRDNRLLSAAKKLRDRLERRMRPGVPWRQWVEAKYTGQVIRIRHQFGLDRVPPGEAVSGYLRLVQEFVDAGLAMETGIALNELGSAYRHLAQPRYAEAEAAVERARAIFEEIDVAVGRAASWHKLGDLHFAQRNLEKSEGAYLESLRIKRKIGDDEGEAITLDHLALVYIAQNRRDQAEVATERSWALLKPFGTPQQKWFPLERLVLLKEERNDISAAVILARLLVEEVADDIKSSKKAAGLLNRLLQRERSL